MRFNDDKSLPAFAAICMLLPCFYFGSYLAILDAQPYRGACGIGENPVRMLRYKAGGTRTYTFYHLAHWTDRRIRPWYWDDPPDPEYAQ